jgi:hypothetical protein
LAFGQAGGPRDKGTERGKENKDVSPGGPSPAAPCVMLSGRLPMSDDKPRWYNDLRVLTVIFLTCCAGFIAAMYGLSVLVGRPGL